MYHRYRMRLKEIAISVLAFAACLIIFIALVLYTGRAEAEVSLDLEYYFLVRDCEDSTSAAVVGEVYSAGGAGYLEGESVVLACYYTKADARRVCSLMEQRGEEVRIDTRSLEKMTLRGSDVAYRDKIEAAAETAKSVARLLYDTANGLETGKLSQTAAKTNLKGAADALDGSISCNAEDIFDKWNRALYAVAADARKGAGGILFSKDVRFLQVSLCCALLEFDRCF